MIYFFVIVVGFYLLYTKFPYLVPKMKEKSTYKPQYTGQWVNKGTEFEEDWVWVEKPVYHLHTFWINVMEKNDGYDIVVDIEPDVDAIEHLDCKSYKEIERGISIINAYYKSQGDIRVINPFQQEGEPNHE